MTNVWGFFLQTLSVTMTAGLLLVVKWLLADKLTPRWQYGVWSVLALRVLLPVTVGRDGVVPVALWLEQLKTGWESAVGSAYTEAYHPIALDHTVPVIQGRPVSVTDWLFVVYGVGVVLWLLWYLLRYVHLRLLLKGGAAPDYDLEAQLIRVRKAYGLPKCSAVMVEGIDTPFVCGVLRPVLAVPKGEYFDDKVILHELLHLQHRDGLHTVFWCVLRCLHWCNPLLQWVFCRIGNDLESLCDQRVLERLEGEERRDYGVILLSMANDSYARMPGTTSVSNGGANIARRIQAIVRFQKYPRGMGLVSVCIGAVLLVPCVLGSPVGYTQEELCPQGLDGLPKAMAVARVERCDTVAGALDTYAKGLLRENGVYIAMVSPYAEHQGLERRMREQAALGQSACRLPAGEKLEFMDTNDSYDHFKYGIYELQEQPDGSYTAWLAIGVYGYADENGSLVQETAEDGTIMHRTRRVYFPVEVYHSDGWCVREIGARVYEFVPFDMGSLPRLEQMPKRSFVMEGDYGTLTVTERTQYIVDRSMEGWHPFGVEGPNGAIVPDGEFVSVRLQADYDYAVKDVTDGVHAIMACMLPSARSESLLPAYFPGTLGESKGGAVDVVYWRMMDANMHLTVQQTAELQALLESGQQLYGYHVQVGKLKKNENGNIVGTELCEDFVVTEEALS